MTGRKQCTKGKVTVETYDASKIYNAPENEPMIEKKKKPVVGVKRCELRIYET
jgi:hypothetical protein